MHNLDNLTENGWYKFRHWNDSINQSLQKKFHSKYKCATNDHIYINLLQWETGELELELVATINDKDWYRLKNYSVSSIDNVDHECQKLLKAWEAIGEMSE